jgi:hypothetical protein
MRQLRVFGPCDVLLDDAGVLHANCKLEIRDDAVMASADAGQHCYPLDMQPGELSLVWATNGAVVRLNGGQWLSPRLRVRAEGGGLVVLGVMQLFEQLEVEANGVGSCVKGATRAFVRVLRAVLRNDARITQLYVADDATVMTDNAQRAFAAIHVHNNTHHDGNGVHIVDVAMHNRRVANWIAGTVA